jgi:hypothetical protein
MPGATFGRRNSQGVIAHKNLGDWRVAQAHTKRDGFKESCRLARSRRKGGCSYPGAGVVGSEAVIRNNATLQRGAGWA